MFHMVTTTILTTHAVTIATAFGATTAMFATDLVDSGGELASGGHVVIPDLVRPCLFSLISGLSVEISENPAKRFAYFHRFSLMW